MQSTARYFFSLAIIYAVVGMALAITMAISHNFGQMDTHSHLMLAGWVSLALMGIFYHLFPKAGASAAARLQFLLQAVASVVMVMSLFFINSGNTSFEVGAGIGSTGYFLGMLLFAWIAMKSIWAT
jgi:hypothetical protein